MKYNLVWPDLCKFVVNMFLLGKISIFSATNYKVNIIAIQYLDFSSERIVLLLSTLNVCKNIP